MFFFVSFRLFFVDLHQTVCAVHIAAALGLKLYGCSLKCSKLHRQAKTWSLDVSQKNKPDNMWESLSRKECFGDHLLKTGLIFQQRFTQLKNEVADTSVKKSDSASELWVLLHIRGSQLRWLIGYLIWLPEAFRVRPIGSQLTGEVLYLTWQQPASRKEDPEKVAGK